MTPEHRRLIDETLERVTAHEKTQAQKGGVPAGEIPGVETLREGWLGQQLTQLAEIAEQGLVHLNKADARRVLDDVYQLLFQGPYDTYPYIPAHFSNEPLGQMLNRARARTLDLEEVVTVTEAAKLTGFSRAQMYLLIDSGRLHPIDMNGRQMLERRELVDVKR